MVSAAFPAYAKSSVSKNYKLPGEWEQHQRRVILKGGRRATGVKNPENLSTAKIPGFIRDETLTLLIAKPTYLASVVAPWLVVTLVSAQPLIVWENLK